MINLVIDGADIVTDVIASDLKPLLSLQKGFWAILESPVYLSQKRGWSMVRVSPACYRTAQPYARAKVSPVKYVNPAFILRTLGVILAWNLLQSSLAKSEPKLTRLDSDTVSEPTPNFDLEPGILSIDLTATLKQLLLTFQNEDKATQSLTIRPLTGLRGTRKRRSKSGDGFVAGTGARCGVCHYSRMGC